MGCYYKMCFPQSEWVFLLQLSVSRWGRYWNRCVAQKCSLVWNYLKDSRRKTSASSTGAHLDELSPHSFWWGGKLTVITFKKQTPLWDQCLENGIDAIFFNQNFLSFWGQNVANVWKSHDLAGNELSAARFRSLMEKYAVSDGAKENTPTETWLIKYNWQWAQKRDCVP